MKLAANAASPTAGKIINKINVKKNENYAKCGHHTTVLPSAVKAPSERVHSPIVCNACSFLFNSRARSCIGLKCEALACFGPLVRPEHAKNKSQVMIELASQAASPGGCASSRLDRGLQILGGDCAGHRLDQGHPKFDQNWIKSRTYQQL